MLALLLIVVFAISAILLIIENENNQLLTFARDINLITSRVYILQYLSKTTL